MPSPLDLAADLALAPPGVRRALEADYARQRKSVLWAYVLWGVVGAHYVYLGKRREQGLFLLTLGGLGVWWALDAVRIPRLVTAANDEVRRDLLVRYHSLARVATVRTRVAPQPAPLPPLGLGAGEARIRLFETLH